MFVELLLLIVNNLCGLRHLSLRYRITLFQSYISIETFSFFRQLGIFSHKRRNKIQIKKCLNSNIGNLTNPYECIYLPDI